MLSRVPISCILSIFLVFISNKVPITRIYSLLQRHEHDMYRDTDSHMDTDADRDMDRDADMERDRDMNKNMDRDTDSELDRYLDRTRTGTHLGGTGSLTAIGGRLTS